MPLKKTADDDQKYKQVVDNIVTKYLNENFDWEDKDFDLLTTMRYDPSLYRGNLALIDAIFEEPVDPSFFYLIDNHVRRINLGIRFFGFKDVGVMTRDILLKHITEAMKQSDMDKLSPCKVRVLVDKTGEVKLDFRGPVDFPLNLNFNTPVTFTAYLDKEPTFVNPFTSFKTTNRTAYETAKERTLSGITSKTPNLDVILYNTAGNVTESTFCNVAFQRDVKNTVTGQHSIRWVTPPLVSGCIEGTMRKNLMDSQLLYEQAISIKSIVDGEEILLFNAVRGILRAKLLLLSK